MPVICEKCNKELTKDHFKKSPKCMDTWPKTVRRRKGENVLEWFERVGKPKK